MQIKYLHPDGSLKALYPYESQGAQQDIAHAIAESSTENAGGFHVIIGENLEDNPTREEAHIITSLGVLIWQHVLDPTP